MSYEVICQRTFHRALESANLPAMRWEKLFADLESQAAEDALLERDAMIDDLREGEQASTSWQQLCGGDVSLTVTGLGRFDGTVVSGNDQVIHVRTPQAHILVSPLSVLEIAGTGKRVAEPSAVGARLGWAYALRLCQRDQDRITVTRTDSSRRAGVVDRVGRDYVRIRGDAGDSLMIPFAAIAAVSCPR